MKNLLLKRNYHVDGTWYVPQEFLESYKSVVKTGLLDQTSSAGDWSGYILQKIGETFHVILFLSKQFLSKQRLRQRMLFRSFLLAEKCRQKKSWKK